MRSVFLVDDALSFLARAPENLTVEEERLKRIWDFTWPRALRGASTVVEFAAADGVPVEFVTAQVQGLIFVSGPCGCGALVVQLRTGRIAEWLAPLLGPVDDLYVADMTGHLIGRASAPKSDLGRDMAAHDIALPLSRMVSAAAAPDPLDGAARLMSARRVEVRAAASREFTSTGEPRTAIYWQVISVKGLDAFEPDLGPVLGQFAAIRVALLGLLLVGSYLFGRTLSENVRQRRLLADANAEIASKGRELELASRHKSEFLANMSHELRTPLNAIIGFSEVLEQRMAGELTPKQAEYVQDIQESGKHQLSLINDLLDLSKIEAGKLELEPESISLPDLDGHIMKPIDVKEFPDQVQRFAEQGRRT